MTVGTGEKLGASANGTAPAPVGPPTELDPAALHGPAGKFVTRVLPHSEANAAALLGQYLTVAGNLFGRRSHCAVEANLHPPLLFCGIVGPTGEGRKGVGFNRVRQVAVKADATLKERILRGLASGEGPLWEMRDAITRKVPEKADGKRTGRFVDQVEDPGVEDKRRLAVESELAFPLEAMTRSGSTLSSVLRELWDCDDFVQSTTKNSPAKATEPFMSAIGHITRTELRSLLSDVSTSNGFGNRWLWTYSIRSQQLPFGGDLPHDELSDLAHDLGVAVDTVRAAGERRVNFANATKARWRDVYGQLGTGGDDLLGSITARGDSQVLRISVCFALLDGSWLIEPEHLEAALALWDYSLRTCRWIWQQATGNELADRILVMLVAAGDVGLSRSELRQRLGGRLGRDDIELALALLLVRRLARFSEAESGGRPGQRWWAREAGS